MGTALTTFGKERLTTCEVLENIDKRIGATEECMKRSQQRYQNILSHLFNVTVAVYLITSLVIYIYFLPKTRLEFALYMTPPALLFPLLMIAIKRLIGMHYANKNAKYAKLLADLQTEKTKVLEEVMENENYRTARCLLERFSQRPSTVQSVVLNAPPSVQAVQSLHSLASCSSKEVELCSISSGAMRRTTSNPMPHLLHAPGDFPGRVLPRPILPANRTFLDKIIDYIVSDGAANRYAMICKQCFGHNGMALQEEFLYLAFRCAFCGAFNPARKVRPVAPDLGAPPQENVAPPQMWIAPKDAVPGNSKIADPQSNVEQNALREKSD